MYLPANDTTDEAAELKDADGHTDGDRSALVLISDRAYGQILRGARLVSARWKTAWGLRLGLVEPWEVVWVLSGAVADSLLVVGPDLFEKREVARCHG